MTARGLVRAWRGALAARARELRQQARRAMRPDPGEVRLSSAWARATAGPWRRADSGDLRRAAAAAPAVLLGDFRVLPSLTIRLPEVLAALGEGPVLLAVGRAATLDGAARDPAVAPWLGERRLLVPFDRAGSLGHRLEGAARRIALAARRHPNARVVVVAGDLLLAPDALPRLLARQDSRFAGALVVHVDPLALHDRVGPGAPLPSLWRSGPRFASLEVAPLFLDDAFVARCAGETELLDPRALESSFAGVLSRVAAAFGIRLPAAARGVPVLAASDPRVPALLAALGENARIALEEIARGESFFLDRPRAVVLGSLSVRHAAEEAAHLLRACLGGMADPRARGEVFYARALQEAIGFAGAILVTGRGDPPPASELERGPSAVAAGARLAAQVLALEAAGEGRAAVSLAARAPAPVLLVAAHLVGYRLGALLAASPRVLRRLLRADLAGPGRAPRLWRRLSSESSERRGGGRPGGRSR